MSSEKEQNGRRARRRGRAQGVSQDPRVCGGRPHIAGTRLSVELIQEMVSAGYTPTQIQQTYAHLSPDQIQAAMSHDLGC